VLEIHHSLQHPQSSWRTDRGRDARELGLIDDMLAKRMPSGDFGADPFRVCLVRNLPRLQVRRRISLPTHDS
jgi:hypothetical protein